jgi:hypothetical protein
MRSAMHNAVAVVAKEKGAMVIEADMLRNAALDSLLRAAEFGDKSQTWFPTGHKAVGGRYTKISLNPATLQVDLDDSSGSINLKIGPEFKVFWSCFIPASQIFPILPFN